MLPAAEDSSARTAVGPPVQGLQRRRESARGSWADEYSDTIDVYKSAGESAEFFKNCYGYAVFPNIAKGGLGVGAAHGNGRVYEQGKYVGDTSMTQVSFGAQAGGQAYSQMIFFENKAAFDQFTSGNFEFGAGVGAVAIKSGASGSVGTTGATASATSGSGESGGTAGKYRKGMRTPSASRIS